jgi:hypothetical protein
VVCRVRCGGTATALPVKARSAPVAAPVVQARARAPRRHRTAAQATRGGDGGDPDPDSSGDPDDRVSVLRARLDPDVAALIDLALELAEDT